MGRGDVVGVRGIGIAGKLGVDMRVACAGVRLGLDDERAAALTDDKAITIGIKGTAGVRRVVVAA